MSYNYLDDLEAEVLAAAEVLHQERYYEHVPCLYELLERAKHYQRLTESVLNGVHCARSFEDNEKELNRATGAGDWYRHDKCWES